MTAYLITAPSAHECALKKCPKKNEIAAGERIVKTLDRHTKYDEPYWVTAYYHEECYQMRGGQRGRKRK